ncbi:MAG TPA: hypothetical protein PLA50_00250 [Bacteroidia bacterium]|nr:hypothetical protein [Bacteroidia bacterium]
MKTLPLLLLASLVFAASPLLGQGSGNFTFFIRQVQMPGDVEWDASVTQQGSRLSPLPINDNGARFELWAVKPSPLTSYLVNSTYVHSYVPVASLKIVSEDPYTAIPRTRIDRPFQIEITVNGLSPDPTAPDAARSVKLLRHVQTYAGSENGSTIDRSKATLLSQGSLNSNGVHTLAYPLSSVPGADRTKAKGEERFSVYSLADYQAPESQLASKFVQIWPMATIAVSGLQSGHVVKGTAPEVRVDLSDLYPSSYTYAQVYSGAPRLGVLGTSVPGASIVVNASVPKNESIHLKNWDAAIPDDGTWTLEILTDTPFGTDRLGYMSFTVERAIKINGAVTSAD